MSDLYIKINSPSLGDTIASTPTIRKLSKIYNKKINVVTHVKEIFLNNEYVNNIFSFEEFNHLNLKIHKNKLFETFLGCGVKNQYGVEKKHNTIDIRQFHALDLGFMLLPDEMFYDYIPLVFENIENLPSDYVCLHVSETWESRTYKKENWQNLINKLNENNIPVVLIGKNSFETGFHTMQKNVFGLNLQNGLDLTNKLSLSQSWHVINKSKVFVTMDSGPMHLAGTTDAFIIQLGSSINNKLRAPYRNNSQEYKYKYISGPCDIFCASDMKYGIKEWGTIQGIPPLIKCLENKSSYECHPNVNQVTDFILNEIFSVDNELFIKRENMKKIGLLFTAYNCENYINSCLDPWIKLKEKHNIKIAANSGMFSDYKDLGFENKNQGTLDKLNQYKFDYFIKTDDQNLLDEDSSRNKCLNYLINEQNCDLIWILDADEIYKELEIENIINYVNKNDALYYSVNFKNYLFTKDYSSDYLPPRIFWTNKNSGIKKFHFDNHITYNDNSVSEVFPHHEIPKDVAYVDHYSWLAEDSRTKEKIIYQNKRFAGEENAKCAFVWDNNYNCLLFNEYFYQKRNLQKSFNYEPPKYLFITAHLSTGGSPKYLEWLIKKTKKQNAKIKVIEWNLYSDTYVVQRNSIINMIGENNFYTVGNYYEDDILFNSKQQNVIDYIKDFNPDFIHLNEFSENFAIKPLSNEIINFLYDKDRTYKLLETTHNANSDILNKKNIPDELWLVSPYQYDIAKNTNIKSLLVEMDIEKKIRPDREKTLKYLGLDPDKMHVLQVGLFSINKNQKFTFEVANQFLNSNVQFHFVGNECYINECSLDKNLNNCRVWGERSDVDLFMSCMDLFVMPSNEELNPIALKEAISWNMKCFVSNLSTINNQYKNIDNVIFIENDNFLQYIKNNLHKFNNNKVSIYHFLNKEPNIITCSFNPSPKVEILGNENVSYNIKFIDDATGVMHFESNINTNMWTQSSIKYYCKWKIIVTNLKSRIESIYYLDLKNKSVKIINDSNSLGDSICWMAAVDKFQKLHNCKIDYYTAKKDLFINEYPNINFYDYGEINNIDYYAQYVLGCFREEKADFFRKDWRLQSLQEIAFSILGLDYIESKTKITIKNKFKLNFNKYVCIATQSTSQSRYWNNDGGWIKTVDYLQKLGYKVVCVDKYSNFGVQGFMNTCPSNVNYFAGHNSFEEIIDIINGCEFFIGLSSGLSWLSWAIGKKIISINGSVGSNFEFYTPYRIINSNVCNSCFNNINYEFSFTDWKWCPTNKNFECSKTIGFEIVKEVIDNLIRDFKKL